MNKSDAIFNIQKKINTILDKLGAASEGLSIKLEDGNLILDDIAIPNSFAYLHVYKNGSSSYASRYKFEYILNLKESELEKMIIDALLLVDSLERLFQESWKSDISPKNQIRPFLTPMQELEKE